MIKKEAFGKFISWMITLMFIMGCWATGRNIPYSINEMPPDSGTICINISNLRKYIEFELSNGKLIKTNKGKSVKRKEGESQRESEFFRSVYQDNRRFEIKGLYGMAGGQIFERNHDGRYVAYIAESTQKGMIRSLVVRDTFENRTVFEKHIDRFIGDITWSPDSSSVAILTMVEKAFAMTHPAYYYYDFYLEIYDMSGRELYRDKVMSNVSGYGRIVWAPHGRQ